MKLPNGPSAVIPREKVRDYLLCATHPHGRSKAAFFTRFGFSAGSWDVLAMALLRHAADHVVAKTEASPFGTRYVVEGILTTPDARTPEVRSVWFIETGEQIPRFVTAYPV